MINWRVRVRNRQFWLAVIPAALLLVQTILVCFGVEWDYSGVAGELLAVVNAVFALLAVLGVVSDPTTEGVGDSDRALGYEKPAARHMGGDSE